MVPHGSTMAAQTHWFKGETAAITTGAQLDNEIQMQRAQNVHGYRAEINIESEAMEANANGHWVVYVFPGDVLSGADFIGTWSQFDDENISQYIWGAGLWMASNQTPFHHTFKPKTSRNLSRGGRVVLSVHVEGTVPVLTNNRVNTLQSYFASE